jgi:hypothetical protein
MRWFLVIASLMTIAAAAGVSAVALIEAKRTFQPSAGNLALARWCVLVWQSEPLAAGD